MKDNAEVYRLLRELESAAVAHSEATLAAWNRPGATPQTVNNDPFVNAAANAHYRAKDAYTAARDGC